jgi:hypothetical protein
LRILPLDNNIFRIYRPHIPRQPDNKNRHCRRHPDSTSFFFLEMLYTLSQFLFHRILREKFFKLTVQLRRHSLWHTEAICSQLQLLFA